MGDEMKTGYIQEAYGLKCCSSICPGTLPETLFGGFRIQGLGFRIGGS